MKKKTLLSDMPLACLELQGLDMHFRHIQNDGVAVVLKAPVETQHLQRFKRKYNNGDSAEKNMSAEQEIKNR